MSGNYNGCCGGRRARIARMVQAKIHAGAWPRPSRCALCYATGPETIQTHLEDCEAPASYIGLCRRCHLALHGRFSRPAIWAALLAGCCRCQSRNLAHRDRGVTGRDRA